MKTWKEFLDEAYAELGPIGEPPPHLYFWYAYRGGKCVADSTRYDLFYGFRRVLRDLRKGNQA